jgi:hypothetical protein
VQLGWLSIIIPKIASIRGRPRIAAVDTLRLEALSTRFGSA